MQYHTFISNVVVSRCDYYCDSCVYTHL